jgi:hypothetical protein
MKRLLIAALFTDFYHDKTGLEMMNILKGNTLITIGIHGMPGPSALEQEKAVATKILSHLALRE